MSTSSVPRSASRTSNPPFTSPSPVPSPVSNLEPDEAWKEQKMREIEDGFQGMIKDAKDRLEASILALTAEKNSPEWEARKERLVEEFKVEKKFIQGLAHEEFMNSVATERFTRGMTITGLSVNATVKQSLLEEQEAILAQIQKDKARRDSTAGPAPEPNISSRSDSPVVSREAPQRAHDSQSSQHETRRPRTVSTSTSSTTNLSVPESVPVRSSPETVKPPANSYHPDPPPPEIRPSSVPQPVVPPVSTNEPAFGSLRRKSSSIAQERRTPRPGTSPVPSSPIDNRRMSTGPTPPTSGSSHRAPTSSSISPAPLGARHDPSRQPTTSPVQERTTHFPGPSTSHPPSARSEPTTSQTWKEATSTPIHVEPYRQGPSSLNSKRSQSNFRNMSEATSAPIPTTPSRPGSSSLNAKRSHSNLQSMSAGTRADDSWIGTELTEEPEEEEEEFGRSVPLLSVRSRDSVSEKPIASSPPTARVTPQVWTPSITPEEDAQTSKIKRDRNGSNLRSTPSNTRKPIPSSFVEASAPAPAGPAVDVQRNAEREAAERQKSEGLWKNLEQSREKEKEKERVESLGRAGGARLSTASEQLQRQNEHVSGGSTSQPEGSSMSTRPADSNSRSFPHPPHVPPSRTVDLPEPPSNPSSFRSPSYLSASYVPNGISTNHLPNVSPSSLGYSPTTEEEDDPSGGGDSSDSSEAMSDTDSDPPSPAESPSWFTAGSSRSSVYSHVYPERTSSTGPPFQAAPSPVAAGGDSHSSAYSHSEWTPGTDPPPVASSRSSTYSYTYATASHPPAVPISIPPRSRTPEDDPSVAYSAGEFSRWGTPQREPRGNSFTDSLRGAGSFSFQDDAIAAKREREDRERAQAREREDQERVQERERQEKQEERERALDAERIARLAEEAERKAEEVKRKEEAAQKKEAELVRQQEETERKLREISEREADLRRREAEVRRREEETKQKELARQREEADKQRKEKERVQAEADKHRKEAEKQFQFEQQAAEIKRRTGERKRQESVDAESSWSGYGSWGTQSRAPPASPSPSNATNSSARSSTTGSSTGTWSSSSSKTSSTGTSQTSSSARSSTATPNSKPTWTGATPTQPNSTPGARPSASSTSKPTPRTSTSSQQSNSGPANPADWARRQQEQAEEQFRKMQEQMERERQAKEQKAGRMLSKDDVVRIYQLHDQQWSKMASHTEVTWDMLPWPVYKKPNSAEEITSGAVDAYIMSPHYPDQDKSTKDRVRQQLRRWHEDHFNQKVLAKVSERDKERVKEAAGTVTRNLNNLLERTNESKKAGSGVFG